MSPTCHCFKIFCRNIKLELFRFSAAEITVFHSGLFSRPLQVVLSFACSVASLSRCPSHYLPGHPHLREDDLAAYLFGKGNPSTWCAELTAIRETPTDTDPEGRQRMTSPDERNCNFVFCTQFFCSSELNNLLRGSVGLATHASCANQLKEIATVGPKPP